MILRTAGASDLSSRMRMLVAGQPGSGKTRFAATFPNVVFANARGGMTSLAESGTRFVDIQCEADMLKLKLMLDGAAGDVEDVFNGPVGTLVVDTLDEFQRILLAERLASERRAETTAGDWGWLGQRMHTIVEGLVELDMNVVLITHLKDVTDGVSGKIFIKPGLQGAFCDQVNQYVDYALMITARHFNTQPEVFAELGSEEIDVVTGPHHDVRYLQSYPTEIYEWVKDLSGTIPPDFKLNFEDDYSRIAAAISEKRGTLAESTASDLDVPDEAAPALERAPRTDTYIKQVSKKAKTEEPQPQKFVETPATDTKCSSCDSMVETQDHIDLSMIRFREPLCSKCFEKRRKES